MITATGLSAAFVLVVVVYWICMQKVEIRGLVRIKRKRGRKAFWVAIGLGLGLATLLGTISLTEWLAIEPPPLDDATLLWRP